MEKKEQLEICCKLLQGLLDRYKRFANFTYKIDEENELVELRFPYDCTNFLTDIAVIANGCMLGCQAGIDRDGRLYIDIF